MSFFLSYLISLGKQMVEGRLNVCQGKAADIECPLNQWVNITSVAYGRLQGCTCQCDICHNLTQACAAEKAFDKLELRCAKKRKCSAKATEEEFGNPCQGIKKALVVTFSCYDVPYKNSN